MIAVTPRRAILAYSAGMVIAPLSHSPSTPLELSFAAQVLVVVTAFGIKPLCMALNGWYMYRFRAVRSAEMRLAGCALAIFLAGETACALNYVLFASECYAVQMFHDLGMALTFALLARALLAAIDGEVLHAEDPRRACALLPLCRRCVKHGGATCPVRTAQRWVVVALAVVAVLPLTVPLRPVRYEAVIFGQPAVLEHGLAEQVAEARVAPLVALACLLAALARAPVDPTMLSLGAGACAFAFFRVLTAFPFLDRIVFMGFWEEASELAMVVMLGKWIHGWSRRQDARTSAAQSTEPRPPPRA